jgi:hypothetical protein
MDLLVNKVVHNDDAVEAPSHIGVVDFHLLEVRDERVFPGKVD